MISTHTFRLLTAKLVQRRNHLRPGSAPLWRFHPAAVSLPVIYLHLSPFKDLGCESVPNAVKGWNDEEVLNYASLVELGQPDFIEMKGVTYCGNNNSSDLTMKNVPYYDEVNKFAAAMCSALNEVRSRRIAKRRWSLVGMHTPLDERRGEGSPRSCGASIGRSTGGWYDKHIRTISTC